MWIRDAGDEDKVPHYRGHEMFHDDMIMSLFIHDQLSFMATINTSSVWSTLIIAMNRWEFIHVWMIIVHICMNSHLFIAMINVDQADDMLIVAMKDCWSFMITYIIMSSWNISWPLRLRSDYGWHKALERGNDVPWKSGLVRKPQYMLFCCEIRFVATYTHATYRYTHTQ